MATVLYRSALLAGAAMESPEHITRFIAGSFRSVWALDLLLLLKQRGGPCQHHELVTLLRASELVVRHSLADLVASGLVVIDEEEYALYAPASERLRDLVEGTQDLYARRPDSVRRQIVSANSRGLSAFADAFRLRKD